MERQKLTDHQKKMLEEANMRISAVAGALLNDECERKLSKRMSQAKSDLGDIQSSLHKFYKKYSNSDKTESITVCKHWMACREKDHALFMWSDTYTCKCQRETSCIHYKPEKVQEVK
jgi:hypothetical protein